MIKSIVFRLWLNLNASFVNPRRILFKLRIKDVENLQLFFET
jgi:hypothetical protein